MTDTETRANSILRVLPLLLRTWKHWRLAVTPIITGFGLIVLTTTAWADGFLNMNAIIRSLAPIEYLPEHQGLPKGKQRSIDLNIFFKLNSSILTPDAERQLDHLAGAMQSESLRLSLFRIAGHTDASGNGKYNQALSERRAVVVKEYLIANRKIDSERLETIGWGEEKLKDSLNPSNAINRRVEIVALGPFPKRESAIGSPKYEAGHKRIKW